MEFKSLQELEGFLKDSIDIALATTVKDKVLSTIIDQAVGTVYDAYTPNKYERRGTIIDEESYEVDSNESLKMKVTAVAEFNKKTLVWERGKKGRKGKPGTAGHWVVSTSINEGNELAGLINYGDGWHGYYYDFVSPEEAQHPTYTAPRPFLDEASELLNDGIAAELLAEGLSKQGIKASVK